MSTKTKTINAGPVGLKPKGAYSGSATYTLLDCVLYNHDSWVCKAVDQNGDPIEITDIAPDDTTYGATYWVALTDGGISAYNEGETARQKGLTAEAQGNTAATKAALADTAAQNADTKAGLADTAAQNADTKAALADEKATLANTKAQLAEEKATLADTAATTANTAASNADDKAALANTKAVLADEKATLANAAATLANTKAQYAQEEGNYAKAQGDYAKAWNDHPPYIGNDDFWYIWDNTEEDYVKSAYAKGDDLHYDEMTPEEYARLVEDVKASVLFASVQTCEDIIDEIQ